MNRSTCRRVPSVAIGLTLALSGCFGGADPTPEPTPSPTVEPVASETPSATVEPTGSPTVEPSETASATTAPSFGGGGGFTVMPNAEADALFLDRDDCTNRQDGYQLEFPDDWWTNTEIARFPACVWFSPTFYRVSDETRVPPEIAITIEWVPGAVERPDDASVVTREEVMVGTQAASRVEWDDDSYWYVIQLGPTPDAGPNLLAVTSADMGGAYELNKAVLDRIMSTIEFIGTTQ